MAFVVFHGLLGIVMVMGVMFHIFEHGMHPAFYPVETKAFIPRSMIPEGHDDDDDDDHEGTGIEELELSPSWHSVSTIFGSLVVVGIVSVLMGSIIREGYPVPRELVVSGDVTNLLLTVGINIGVFVLFAGLVLSMYGNVMRVRWEKEMRRRQESETVADGGEPRTDD
jgi:hypothetical protein